MNRATFILVLIVLSTAAHASHTGGSGPGGNPSGTRAGSSPVGVPFNIHNGK